MNKTQEKLTNSLDTNNNNFTTEDIQKIDLSTTTTTSTSSTTTTSSPSPY